MASLMMQHCRAVHRDVFLNIMEMVYDSHVRGIDLFSGYVASRDTLTLALVSMEASKSIDDRHICCIVCGYRLAYRGKPHEDDNVVDSMMAAHVKVCHRDKWHEARSVAMGAVIGGNKNDV